MRTVSILPRPKLKRLAACLSAALALAAADSQYAHAGTAQFARHAGALLGTIVGSTIVIDTVTQCTDDGTSGTLRYVIAHASDGDYVDVSRCSTITLQSGEIPVAQNNLTIFGPTTGTTTIDANGKSRVFHHNGGGTLAIDNLALVNGKYKANVARGGCIYSQGSVSLSYASLHNCTMADVSSTATTVVRGAGIFSSGKTTLNASTVSGNLALGGSSGSYAAGGGVYAKGGMGIYYSEVSSNVASGRAASGGGVVAYGVTKVANSTLDGNQTSGSGGAIYQFSGGRLYVTDSTISGNQAHSGAGIVSGSFLSIVSSTIAFNTADASGLVSGVNASSDASVQSSIIAKNAQGPVFADFYIASSKILSGSNNLIVSSNRYPPGTLTGDPLLTPLAGHDANNGLRLRMHALNPLSPAVDMGNNSAGLAYDERGQGYERVRGAAADIGAYERQAIDDDEIFGNGFD